MKLTAEPYEQTLAGTKTIEMRLYDEKRQQVRVGDQIVFTKIGGENESFTAEVLAIHVFPSFKELFETLPLEKCGYTKETKASAKPEDLNKFYSHEEQAKYQVLGIEIKVL